MNKSWYMSKAVWGAVFLGLAGIAEALGVAIPEVVFTLAGALGIYGVRDAIKD